MQHLNFLLKLERNPLLPILLALAAFIALAPDFEVPQSSRIESDSQQAQRWATLD